MAKVLTLLENEWDLFNLPWNAVLLSHIHEVSERAGMHWEEEKLIRSAFLGYVLDFEELNGERLLALFETWLAKKPQTPDDIAFRNAILDAIREEFRGRK